METPTASVLVVEDEKSLRSSIRQNLELDGYRVREAATVKDGWDLTRENVFDAVITDLNLIGDSGMELIRRLRDDGFEGVIIVITAYGTVDSAVEAVKLGADEYLQKPVSLQEIGLLLKKALANRRMRSRLDLLERMERVRGGDPELIGASQVWLDTLTLARRLGSMPVPPPSVAGSPAAELPTILLLGETGVGKGALAPFIHRSGAAAGAEAAPFVHVNCAALPVTLIEGELFGHERGSFTDAKDSRPGLFEMAEGGTIFLDEIGDMPLEMQSKLLVVVEKGVFRRIGGNTERSARARIIAATNQDLEQRASQGSFRRDLLYRLNALTVHIPPLRERGDDVILIAEAMLERLARNQPGRSLRLSEGARTALRAHSWPGNVRELINVVKRAAIMCPNGTIRADDIAIEGGPLSHGGFGSPQATAGHGTPGATVSGSDVSFGAALPSFEHLERTLILEALKRADGNVSLAAKLIGLQRGALRYRLDRLGLSAHGKDRR